MNHNNQQPGSETGINRFTIKQLRKEFAYDPQNGRIYRAEAASEVGLANAEPVEFEKKGYWYVRMGKFTIPAHQVAWALTFDEFANASLDHIDRDKKNNRIPNLRKATGSQNMANVVGRGSTQGKGVYWDARREKYQAQITYKYRTKHLGHFADLEDAAHAYNKAAVEIHGEFAVLNPIGVDKTSWSNGMETEQDFLYAALGNIDDDRPREARRCITAALQAIAASRRASSLPDVAMPEPVAKVSAAELRDIQSGSMGVPVRGAGWREDQNIPLYLAAQPAEGSAQVAKEWRCFHCDESFPDRDAARLHFGTSERQSPICAVDQAEYRAMEKRMEAYNAEDAEIHHEMYAQRNRHAQELLRAEEKGYARGLKDAIPAAVVRAPADLIQRLRNPQGVVSRASVHDDMRQAADLLEGSAVAAESATPAGELRPELTVWYRPVPESNGKSNFTATLVRKGADFFDTAHYTFSRSEYPDRVRYEADFMRYLIGERAERPEIWDKGYDFNKHSGYVARIDGDKQGEQGGGKSEGSSE